MNTRVKSIQIKPQPPFRLDANSLGVWMGWCKMTDKEVAREAATKGTHVNLVLKFLSARTALNIEETEKWFKDEIICWILELLTRNQVFKASHILNNINIDPISKMLEIFLDATCKELRDNVGNHLLKNGKLVDTIIESWTLLTIIENYYDIIFLLKEKFSSINIKLIIEQSLEWKNQIGTELLFRSFDFRLESFIKSNNAWNYLLKTNSNLVKLWINVYFGRTISIEICDINIDVETVDKLNNLFLKLSITQEMVDTITNGTANVREETQNLILNELSAYGIFNSDEKENIISMIKRFVVTNNIENLHQILTRKYTGFQEIHFNELLINYCIENNLFGLLNICMKDFSFSRDFIEKFDNQYLNVMVDLRNLCQNLNNEIIFRNNIFEVAQLLSSHDLQHYFSSFPIILLSLVLFSKDVTINDVLINKVSIKIKDFEINSEVILHCLKNFDTFISFYNRVNGVPENKCTLYDLLEKHAKFNIKEVYNFRFNSGAVPHFSSPDLVKMYGYNKDVSFLFYLKQGRPSYACKIFHLDQLEKYSVLEEQNVKRASEKVYKTALKNILSITITTSCVAFLEMIGEKSDVLRIYIKSADIIHKSDLLDELEILQLYSDIELNCELIFNTLEECIIKEITINTHSTGSDLIRALKTYDIVVKFSTLHNLKLPELFLKYCAENNLWLPFFIYIQIYKYPVDLTCKLTQYFNSTSLLEHLSHCISHDIQMEESKHQLMGDRDLRKYFLLKLGVKKSIDMPLSSSEQSLASHSSYGSMTSSAGSDFMENDAFDCKTDLLQTLIKCHNSTDPPKALLHAARYYKVPFFAVIATSYEPDSVITNWATWLVVSCDIEDSIFIYDSSTITSDIAIELFKLVLEKSCFRTLENSFGVFLSENPLKVFMEFLNQCILLNFDDGLLSDKLNIFNQRIKHSRNNSFITGIDNEMTFFNNKLWLQNAAVILFSLTLQYGFKSRYNQIEFLNCINRIDIQKYFFIDCPNFNILVDILQYICDSEFDISLDFSVIYDENKYSQEITQCINKFVNQGLYSVALNIAKVSNMTVDYILLKEIQNEFASRSNKIDFWAKWNEVFCKAQICPITAVKFYTECAAQIDSKLEKYEVLKLAYNWSQKFKLDNLLDVEISMWVAYFYLEDYCKKMEPVGTHAFTFYSDVLKELDDIPSSTDALKEKDIKYLDKAIEDLLNIGDIYTVLRLERIFAYSNIDLDMLKLILQIAEGILMPYQLSSQQRCLLSKRPNVRGLNIKKRKYTSTRLSSMSSSTHSPSTSVLMHVTENVAMPLHDTLQLLDLLTDNLVNGVHIAQKIFKTYRISINIKMKYQEVVECKNPIDMLRQAFKSDCENKLEVLGDFVFVFKLSKDKIADFICEEIINAAIEYSNSKIDMFFLWDMDADTDFNLVLQLLTDNCSILGLKLYSYASAVHKSQIDEGGGGIMFNDIVLVIELLIRSHNCFTADCNMEGISMILKKCKIIISDLTSHENWKLIVRLFTGIARYIEMNYVFQILRVNGQFELLLRKGSRKDNGIKVALLQYLKKFCPDDIELYKIVALHFFLFSEIAILWEHESETIIKRLITLSKLDMENNKISVDTSLYVSLTNTDDTNRLLNKIMTNYKHAAEYHMYGEKVTKAMNAAKQAELLALQISLFKDLGSGTRCVCLLNLTQTQIASLLLSQLSFPQALILIEAYNYQADWASMLFEQYLIRNNSEYFLNFLSSFQLTENIVNDISKRYLLTQNITADTIANMKDILNKLPSVHTKYRIASELGFYNIIEELLASNQIAYLKDTVWKKGYKD